MSSENVKALIPLFSNRSKISANTIGGQGNAWSGTISAKGGDGLDDAGHSGAGSGGSIRIEADTITVTGSGSVTAAGGSVGSTTRGGGVGRVAIFYHDQFSGSLTPNYLAKTALIFSDNFESNSLANWSSATTDGGNLAVSTAAANGSSGHGLQAVINDTNPLFVQDNTPASETRYRAAFDFNPNGLVMGSGDILDLLTGYSDKVGSSSAFHLQLQKVGAIYQVRIGAYLDSANWMDSAWQDLNAPNGWSRLEIEFISGAGTGEMNLWDRGFLMQTLDSLDNDTAQVSSIRLGAMGVDSGTGGTIYFDNFAAQRLLVDSIFSDSFESNITSQSPSPWSVVSGDGDHLRVASEGVYWGINGLSVAINATPESYVEDDTPQGESQYHARFYVKPDGVTMGASDILDLFNGYSGTDTNVFHVQMRQNSGVYQVSIGALNGSGAGTWKDSTPTWYNLGSGWNAIEIEYLTGNATGEMSLWVDGTLKKTIVAIDNNGRSVDFVRLGAMGVEATTSGMLYFDDFDSRRFSNIGVLADPGAHNPGLFKYTFTSQPDGAEGQDTYLNSGSGGTNYGASTNISVGELALGAGKNRGLIKFDLSSIPANATITSAKLYLNVRDSNAYNTRMMRLYRLTHDWAENQANWNIYSTGNNWAAAGGAGDIDATETGSVSVSINSAPGDVIEIDLNTNGEFQKMIAGTNANNGWLLKMDTELNDMYSFASSDDSNAAYRPKLVIEYSTTTEMDPWTDRTYTYSPDKPHAVTELTHGDSAIAQYEYDANGNMICREENNQTFLQFYNAENRLYGVWAVDDTCDNPGSASATWQFFYDGDGNRVKQVYTGASTLTTYYFAGGSYEMRSDGTLEKYYAFGGQNVAMVECTWTPDGNGSPVVTCPDKYSLKYFLTDHLGSVVAVLGWDNPQNPQVIEVKSQQRYYPFGGQRDITGDGKPTISETDFTYTGQRDVPGMGLMDYKARFYDDYLTHFNQPDSIIPDLSNPQSLNRFAYALNNPIRYNDPTGHFAWLPVLVIGGAVIGAVAGIISQSNDGGSIDWGTVGKSALLGAAIGLTVAVAAPLAVGLIGEGLTGAGLLTGSTALFGAGMAANEASTALSNAMTGVSAAQSTRAATSTRTTTNANWNSMGNNNSGGTFWGSDYKVDASDVAQLTDDLATSNGSSVTVLSGVHGSPSGAISTSGIPNPATFLTEDQALALRYSNVQVLNMARISDAELAGLSGNIICGWCWSQASTRIQNILIK